MRSDAAKNYNQLLAVARVAVGERGAGASLRDIARRANVGLPTLYRHFPTREALLEVLLRAALEGLTDSADELATSSSPREALASWLREGVAFVRTYHGMVDLMAAALEDEKSALHAACAKVRSAGGMLLARAQADGSAHADIDGVDLFALIGAAGWIGDQTFFAERADQFVELLTRAILLPSSSIPLPGSSAGCA